MATNPNQQVQALRIKEAETNLARLSKHDQPEPWVNANFTLSQMYHDLAHSSADLNPTAADKSIEYNRKALEIVTEERMPGNHANAQSNMGSTYLIKKTGNIRENLAKALECYTIALRANDMNRKDGPDSKAEIHCHISAILRRTEYRDSGKGRAANLDLSLRHELAALQFYTKAEHPLDWGRCHKIIGESYHERTTGNEKSNWKLAIKHSTLALQVFTIDSHRHEWAMMHSITVYSYDSLIEAECPTTEAIDAGEVTEKAVTQQQARTEKQLFHALEALKVFSQSHFPGMWVELLKTTNILYGNRRVGDRNDSREKTIEYCNKLLGALNVTKVKYQSNTTAKCHVNMARAYAHREIGTDAGNKAKVVEHYTLCLKYFTPTEEPLDFYQVHLWLGQALLTYQGGTGLLANVKKSIVHHKKALEFFTELDFPEEWAHAHINLGLGHYDRKTRDRTSLRTKSIQHFRLVTNSKRVKETAPDRWTEAWVAMGQLYQLGLGGMSEQDSVEKAMECFSNCLTMCTVDSPDWEVANFRLAKLFSEREKGDRSTNMHKSLEHYAASMMAKPADEASENVKRFLLVHNVFEGEFDNVLRGDDQDIDEALEDVSIDVLITKEASPIKWAENQIRLADKFLKRVDRGERIKNVEKAIGHYKTAVEEVFTKEAFPDKWADVQMQLCAAYLQRVEGVRRDNMESAIRCFNACKEVRAEEVLPDDWLKQQWAAGAEARKKVAEGRK